MVRLAMSLGHSAGPGRRTFEIKVEIEIDNRKWDRKRK
jgi:hypothetical protein